MVSLSKRTEYALLAMIDLAVEGQRERVQLKDIAARQAIPDKYLEQLFRPLKAAGLVRSTRGSRGGYVLARPTTGISVLEIVEAVDGPLAAEEPGGYVLPGARVVRDLWRNLAEAQRRTLAALTLADLADRYRAGRARHSDWVI